MNEANYGNDGNDTTMKFGEEQPVKKPKKKTQKQIYEEEMKKKQREWRKFLRFMKKNPEVLLGIAEQHAANMDSEPKQDYNQVE